MNRDDIIRMAREAGFEQAGHLSHQGFTAIIERFATLVAAAEREACIKALQDQIGWDIYDPESTATEVIRARGKA